MRLCEYNIGEKRVYLTRERWKHIVKEHPTMVQSFLRVEETLQCLLEQYADRGDTKLIFYYRYFKDAPPLTKFLVVIVKYLNGEGFIVTSFYVKRMG